MVWPSPCPGTGSNPDVATPNAVDTTPSIPLAPRFASTRGGTRCVGGKPFEITDRHGGGHDDGRPVRRGKSVDGARNLWFAQIGPEHAGDGRLGLVLPCAPGVEPLRLAGRRLPPAPSSAKDPPRTGGIPSPTAGDPPTVATGRPRPLGHRPEQHPTRTHRAPGRARGSRASRWCPAVAVSRGGSHRPPRWSRPPCSPTAGRPCTGHPSRSASASTRAGSAGRGAWPPTMTTPRPRSGSTPSLPGASFGTTTLGPARGGSVVGDPVSGSRKSRLRCTGPGPEGPRSDSARPGPPGASR